MFGDESGFLCVYVGRISNEKRLDVIIDAVRNLRGEQKAYLAIVGMWWIFNGASIIFFQVTVQAHPCTPKTMARPSACTANPGS